MTLIDTRYGMEPASNEFQTWFRDLAKPDQNTWEAQERWLSAFSRLGTMTKACGIADIHRNTVRNWEVSDRFGFRQRQRDAQTAYADYLEGVALDRVESPEGNRGSDTLLIALNNANNPDKWRGNNVTVEVSNQLITYMQKRQAEDRALPASDGSKVIEHVPSDDKPPWED